MYGVTVTLASHSVRYNLYTLIKAVDSRIPPWCHQYFATIGSTPIGSVTFGDDSVSYGIRSGTAPIGNAGVYTSPVSTFNGNQLDSDYVQGSVDNMVIDVAIVVQ